uniref:Large ribosomal subunit protein uL6c n=1 Tax=Tolypiocladia glomerulata TaxID=860646 RepID=A0A1Z1MUN7_9FLOR|nr:ribosomal protein L6 [Tolypiocladia glomerulata]ARW69793.1 ribosomal protein L6 [Tolypiocladia glomerulata]
MSRIGKKEIEIPKNTQIQIKESKITIKGTKGEMEYKIPQNLIVENTDNKIQVKIQTISKKTQALHGLCRSIINNMVIGVSKGFEKKLIIQGVGYRSHMDERILIVNVGYSHPVKIEPPEDIDIKVENNTNITISGISKEKVGQVAATIRSIRSPEPYKGKGIRYSNEIVRRKVGKAGK